MNKVDSKLLAQMGDFAVFTMSRGRVYRAHLCTPEAVALANDMIFNGEARFRLEGAVINSEGVTGGKE